MLDQAPRRTTALFLGVLVLLSTAAALVLPDSARGESFETVDTLGTDAEAHAVTLHDGDRVRFTLQPEAGEATPKLRFALYDPVDRHFASFTLEGMGDHVEVLADRPGDWVVVVVSQENANLAVQLPKEQARDGPNRVQELDVTESTRTLVDADGGAVDEQVAFRLPQRPAVAFLRAQGTMERLDATLDSEEGPVYGIQGMTKNATTSERGTRDVTLPNLAAGTYTATVLADHLNGSVDLVVQHYERAPQDVAVDNGSGHQANGTADEANRTSADGEDANETATRTRSTANKTDGNGTGSDGNATSASDEDGNASTDAHAPRSHVATLEEGTPAWVASGDAAHVTLRVDPGSEARVHVYNGSDDLVQVVELEAPHRHDEANASGDAATVAVPAGSGFVVYVQELHGDAEGVEVLLEGVSDAGNATRLDTHETTLSLDGDAPANASLSGGLLSVDVETQGVVQFHREVNVTGPRGVVLAYEQSLSTFGMAWTHHVEEHPDRFGDGEFVARADGGDGWRGGVTVTLVSYVR